MSYKQVRLYAHRSVLCNKCPDHLRHAHCGRCNRLLLIGSQVGRFRNKGWKLTGIATVGKVYCLDCGKALSDSTVRAE